MPSFNARQQLQIASADRSQIEAHLRKSLTMTFAKHIWLAPTNRYRERACEHIKEDVAKSGLHHRDMCNYVAASVPTHLIDGWCYFGRSVESLLRGDYGGAIHLAYYAELRAAASLLAADGVGVFNHQHIIIDSSGTPSVMANGGGTHEFVWHALECWSSNVNIQRRLMSTLQPRGLSILDFLTNFQGGTGGSAISQSWTTKWGLDLRLLSEDRGHRNNMSYRPTTFRSSRTVKPSDSVTFINELWKLFEPTASGRFDRLDMHILRNSLKDAYSGVNGLPTTSAQKLDAQKGFELEVRSMLSKLPLNLTESLNWEGFLLGRDEPQDAIVLRLAPLTSHSTDAELAMQMLSRASLLLRLATGSSLALLRAGGVDASSLAFWWHAFGAERGHWPESTPPSSVVDTWADVEVWLNQSETWLASSKDPDLNGLRSSAPAALTGLGMFDIVSTWGLAS